MAEQAPLYSAAQLTEMLSGILHSTDNNERRSIEGAVVRSLSTPANLVQLVNVLCGNLGADAASMPAGQPSNGVRQLAAVLLRKKIFSLWRSLDAPQQRELRGLLLAQLGNEPVRIVRFAIAHIVTRLAKADVSGISGNDDGAAAAWPELQQAIRSAVEDPRVEMRELSMVLVYSLAEVFAEENAFVGLVAESVLRGLADTDGTVQSAAVKAAMMLLPSLAAADTSIYVPFLQQLVPQCLGILTQHAAMKDSGKSAALCVSVLDMIEQLLDSLSAKKNGDVIGTIVNQLLGVLANRATNARVRQNCGTTLAALVSAKPKFIVSHGLLPSMIQCCLALMSEDATISLPDEEMMGDGDSDHENDKNFDNGDGDNDDEDELDMLHVHPACRIGVLVLISLATSVANKAFAAALMPFVSAVTEGKPFAGVNVADPLVRKSAILALACLAEGNPGYLRRRVGFVLQVMKSYFQDGHPVVRESAAFALSACCLCLQPEMLTHHAELFPLLVPLLKDPNDLVRCRAADALDTLCENVAEDLEPYISLVLPAVVEAIAGSSLPTQKALCGVISSMAMTHCPALLAYVPSVMELLRQPFAIPPTPETIPLRAQATETVGIMGVAMGKEAFAPYFPVFMHHIVVENFALGSAALREQSFGFLNNICQVLGEDFVPFLDDSITEALRTIEDDKAVFTNKHLLAKAAMPLALADDMEQLHDAEKQRQHQGEGGGGGGDDDDEDDDDDDAAEIHMRVRTADIEEKCSAINAIGVFAESLLTLFGPERVARCREPLSALEGHYYANVRSNMMLASARLVKASHGKPTVDRSATEDTLDEVTRDMLDDLIHQTLLKTMHEDVDKDVAGAACEAMQILLDFFGPQCFPFGPDAIVKECILFLRQKSACQLAVDVDYEDSDQDDHDGEDVLFREADELIAANHNASWRDVVRPDMVLQGVRLAEDHDDVILDYASDMLDSLAKAYGPVLAPYAPYLVPLLLQYCDPHSRDASDVTMGVGSLAVLLQSLGTADAAPFFDAVIAVSFAILQSSDESTARGNSCYLLRILIESCPARFTSDVAALQQTLQALWSVAAGGEDAGNDRPSAASARETPGAVDNAVSATCSLVRCCSLPPQGQSSPSPLLAMWPTIIPPMLRGVPMRLDKEENANAVQTLVFLLAHPQVSAAVTASAAWLPELVRCIANMFASRTVEASVKDVLIEQGVRVFVQANEAAWRAARQSAQLNAEQEAAMAQAGY